MPICRHMIKGDFKVKGNSEGKCSNYIIIYRSDLALSVLCILTKRIRIIYFTVTDTVNYSGDIVLLHRFSPFSVLKGEVTSPFCHHVYYTVWDGYRLYNGCPHPLHLKTMRHFHTQFPNRWSNSNEVFTMLIQGVMV